MDNSEKQNNSSVETRCIDQFEEKTKTRLDKNTGAESLKVKWFGDLDFENLTMKDTSEYNTRKRL